MAATVNVLLSTLSGLGLPSTICLPLPSHFSVYDLLSLVEALLPCREARSLRFTTLDNQELSTCSDTTLARLAGLPSNCGSKLTTTMLSVRMSAVLVGGKGGFGSQLRAAGGRMSSRKKRQNAELATGSARNLDGRRLRTITEAKNLATYLATKPDMDRKQKEERRKRWEQIIDMAEQREADMKAGKTADGRRKGLSEEWIEEKEEVGENVKNAVKMAMAMETAASSEPDAQDRNESDHSPAASADGSEDEEPMELEEEEMARLTREAEQGDPDALWVLQHKLKIPASLLPKPKQPRRKFAGFDEDETSSSDEDGQDEEVSETTAKGKAVAAST